MPVEIQDLEDELCIESKLEKFEEDKTSLKDDLKTKKFQFYSTELIERYKTQLNNIKNNREFTF